MVRGNSVLQFTLKVTTEIYQNGRCSIVPPLKTSHGPTRTVPIRPEVNDDLPLKPPLKESTEVYYGHSRHTLPSCLLEYVFTRLP